jgi:anoctamin-10
LCRIGGSNATTGPDLDMLNQYFGSQIALYFGWLDFYSSFLRYPALFGAILFIYQIITGEVDTPGSPYFLLFLAVWSTCFLEYWKQQNAKLAQKWGVLRIDEEQKLKQIAKVPPLILFFHF